MFCLKLVGKTWYRRFSEGMVLQPIKLLNEDYQIEKENEQNEIILMMMEEEEEEEEEKKDQEIEEEEELQLINNVI